MFPSITTDRKIVNLKKKFYQFNRGSNKLVCIRGIKPKVISGMFLMFPDNKKDQPGNQYTVKYSWKITLAKHFSFFCNKKNYKIVAKNAATTRLVTKKKIFSISTQLYLIFVFKTCKSSILLHFKMTNTALSQNLPDKLKFKVDLTVQSLS